MTACVNRKHTKKVAAVVTASLVGALSLGVAPVAAMATEGEISLQALDSSAIAGGTVTYKGGEDGQTFTYNGHKQGLSADTLDPKGGADAEKLQAHPGGYPEAGYYYYYIQLDGTADSTLTGVQYTDANGNKQTVSGKYLGGEMPDEVGSYAVVTGYWSGSAWTYVSTAARFTIAPQSLEGATIFEGTDVNDTEFAWDGFNYTNTPALIKADMGVALDGVILNPTTDYSLKIIDPATGAEPTYVMPGTTYAAHIEGAGNYAGQHEDVKFTFGKCDIADLNIVGKVANRTAPQVPYAIASIVDSIDGKTNFADFAPNQYTIEFVSGPDGAENDWTAGTYTFKIKANPGSTLVEGEQTFQYINAERVADITYDGDAWNTAFPTGEYNVDFSSETAEALSPPRLQRPM